MMLRSCALIFALALTGAAASAQTASPMPPPSAPLHEKLQAFFAAEWERGLRESPEGATYQGDTRYNDRWTDLSLAAIAERETADRASLVQLHAIPRAALSSADQLDYDTFEWQLLHNIERQRFREYLEPVDQRDGVQQDDGIAETMPFDSVADYCKFLARMAAVPAKVAQTVVLMQEGVKAGIVPPRVLVSRVPEQIAAQIVKDPTQSPFYRPFLKFADSVPVPERAALQEEARHLIVSAIVPAFQKMQDYVEHDYLPHTRLTVAATDRPDGQAYYGFMARYYTTTDLSPAQIHEIGLKEVARLHAAMEALKDQIGFKGSLQQFFTELRTDPKFFYKTPAELLVAYRDVAKRIDPELVRVFKTIPRLPYGVRPIPDNTAPTSTTAYYQGGAADGTRPGYFYVNLYQPESRPKWEMMPLTLHESVPGHHFQFARALELPDEPMFRKTAYFVAYGEGWGLYAEQLGYDMNLYNDPYDHFGQLTYEMWRAVRLVVDTGMHSMGWSREQAIAYFKLNAPKTDLDIANEVDRYIAWPGQALAYKIGQMKISELRARASQALGPKFDLREYNDTVLATGSVPLTALEARIDAWIREVQAR